MKRRNFLKTSAAGFAAASLFSSRGFSTVATAPVNPLRKRVFRIAHLTDIHVEPTSVAQNGMAKALHAVQNMKDKPDVIFNGGDSIMDALKADKERVKTQWKVWNNILHQDNSLEIVHCIGNHDVWGWSKSSGKKRDELYGKRWAMDEFNLVSRYYSFDRAGWHFIVLDSTHHRAGGYTARLDEEQFEWLQDDLQKTQATIPVCILSHIPIISFCPFFDGNNEKKGNWQVPGAWMHIDARRIKDVFYKHKNVKIALSGHIHLQDSVEYLGVKYFCNGAVSGAWWSGNNQEFPPAYAIIDLFDDGSSENEFFPYEWK